MAPACPKCATELRDDYGMVTCPGCGSIVFVDLEGNANVASDSATEKSALPPSVPDSSDFPAIDIPSFDPAPFSASGTEQNIAPIIKIEGGESDDPPINPGMDMNAFLGYAPEQGMASPDGSAPASQGDPNDPLGISAYSNSEFSTAKNGPLVVTLIISGIDAKDLRDEIRQALQDSRFGWDTAALMSGIKGGTLRIEQVSPVKATIIINRIKNLSVRIRWEQNAITEIEPVSPKP